MRSAKEWVLNTLFDFAQVGGVAAHPEQAKQRAELCRSNVCGHYGDVRPTPFAPVFKGCTLCGCPTATKTKYLTLPRLLSNKDKKLTIAELLTMQEATEDNEFFDSPIICPDATNRWALIDNVYK